jgi:hypothetical protein
MTDAQPTQGVLRAHAEIAYAEELAALATADDRPRPPSWRLSPWAVTTYILGGTLPNGVRITPKYLGSERLVEIAVASLATDRALLLLGVPGTAKSWVSEHLAAAICGNLVPATGAVHGRHGRDPDPLRLELRHAAGPGPVTGRHRSHAPDARHGGREPRAAGGADPHGSDVQDTLITVLSAKRCLPIPELNDRGPRTQARLQHHRHRQQPRQGRQ